MAQAKTQKQSEEQPRTARPGSCMYVGDFHELPSESYRRYKLASERFADIAEHQAPGG